MSQEALLPVPLPQAEGVGGCWAQEGLGLKPQLSESKSDLLPTLQSSLHTTARLSSQHPVGVGTVIANGDRSSGSHSFSI